MRRREFVFLIGGAAILSPVAVVAEEHARKRQVGLLSVGSGTDPEWQSFVAGFTERLRRLGWPEDRVAVHARFSDAEPGRLEKEAAELVARSPDVIVV
ncbi:MAG TPA: hypothetical protein VLX85_17560, partial [Stellaceae bacterium]|nr:hypothetical protein [Stellaceae bacterium]